MTKLVNNVFIVPSIFKLWMMSCKNTNVKEVSEGYLNSDTYKAFLRADKIDANYTKEDLYNADYSVKRMFMLLGDEAFLYNSDYDFYAVYMCMHRGRDTIDYFILKSKDSIYSLSHKKVVNAHDFLYVKKNEDDLLNKKSYNIDVNTEILEAQKMQSFNTVFNKKVSLLSPETKYFDYDGGQLRCIYLFDKKDYYFITEHKVPVKVMDQIDSFYRSV